MKPLILTSEIIFLRSLDVQRFIEKIIKLSWVFKRYQYLPAFDFNHVEMCEIKWDALLDFFYLVISFKTWFLNSRDKISPEFRTNNGDSKTIYVITCERK